MSKRELTNLIRVVHNVFCKKNDKILSYQTMHNDNTDISLAHGNFVPLCCIGRQ